MGRLVIKSLIDMIEVRLGYWSLPHQSLVPTMMNDGYAGPVQIRPSFMQAIEDPRPQFVDENSVWSVIGK